MLLLVLGAILGLLAVYLYRLNCALYNTPLEAEEFKLPDPTDDELRSVYDKVKRDGIQWKKNLPPKQDRRYIVVGGSGMIGSQMIMCMLANGTSPQAIRIIDAQKPTRPEFTEHGRPEGQVAFVPADITTEDGTLAAFAAPWPEETAKLPLTVFHTAALIRFQERHQLFWERSAPVNITGTAHVITAARKVGAGILIATSSSTIENHEVHWFPPPWERYPRGFAQFVSGEDFKSPLRPDSQFLGCYTRTKAIAERLVCDANEHGGGSSGMRTGTIRAGNGVYGHKNDFVLGRMLQMTWVPSMTYPCVQNWVYAVNVALAHLQLESALLGPHGDKVSGRPFLVTDDGPAIQTKHLYQIMSATSVKGFTTVRPPPLLMLSGAFMIEWWAVLAAKVPLAKKLIGEPPELTGLFQPTTVAHGLTSIINDAVSKKSPEEGGMGYKPACTSVEGICAVVREFNDDVMERAAAEASAETEAAKAN